MRDVESKAMSEPAAKKVIDTPLAELYQREGAALGNWFGCALPDRFSDDWLAEYRALRKDVALLDKNYRTYLLFTGPDRVRYLNAILTNDIKSLTPGNGVASLFLNPQGRIQAEIETYAEAKSLFCVSYAMIREALVAALDKYIIMDDVTMTDKTDAYGTLALEGPSAAELTKRLTGTELADMSDLGFRETSVAGMNCGLLKRSLGVASAEFLTPRQDLATLWGVLRDEVTKAGGQPAGYQALSALRLEQGIPWFGYDFGEKQIPHEAGLQDSHISYSKGCYTGQEIVERVRSRGQVNRIRVLLKFAGTEIPASGASLLADGKEVGHVTRAAFSPRLQAPIAMGYVRRESSVAGSEALCGSERATVIAAPVTEP